MDGHRWAQEILLSAAYSRPSRTDQGYVHRNEYAHRKKRKFFSPEEKARILSRVKVIGITDAAREANTWPDVIERWIKDMDREPAETIPKADQTTKQSKDEIETTPEVITTEKGSEIMKQGKDFTPEEKTAIIARAKEVGAKKAAEEVGTSPRVVSGFMTRLAKRAEKIADVIPGQDGLPERRDDYHDYTDEERKLLVKKADDVGRARVQRAYGLKNYTLRDWERTVKRRTGKVDAGTADIIPGENGLPEKRLTHNAYTPEERRLLVAKTAEVGKAKIRKVYGLRDNTLYDWEMAIKRKEKKAAVQARVDEKPETEIKEAPMSPAVIPVENGLPAKRDNLSDYTPEEKRLIVEKADEVGNPAVKAAYGFEKHHIIYDWRRSIKREERKAKKSAAPAVQENASADTTAVAETLPTVSIAPEQPVHESLIQQPEKYQHDGNYRPDGIYPPEIEVILLREQVAALTDRIEKLRKAIAALMGTVL